jgi:hypothetical protein
VPEGQRFVDFGQLANADLRVGWIYRGGTTGNVSSEVINKLLPGSGNQGGFRPIRDRPRGNVRAVVLFSTGAVSAWPDELDPATGTYTYFGDNRKPGNDLEDTLHGGNRLLGEVFPRTHGTQADRAQVPPFLLFDKPARGWAVRFQGLLAPGAGGLSRGEDLVVVNGTEDGQTFHNYRAHFTVLKTPLVSRSWIEQVLSGNSLGSECPAEWREWVETQTYLPLTESSEHDTGSLPGAVAALGQEPALQAEFDEESARDAPGDDYDARKRSLRQIVARRGQSDFRRALIDAYQGRCAITGCDAIPALEAAHLRPYRGPESNIVSNGLLLRADIHTLLDLGLIAIDPGSRMVTISRRLAGTHYEGIAGVRVADTLFGSQRPTRATFDVMWHDFQETEGGTLA